MYFVFLFLFIYFFFLEKFNQRYTKLFFLISIELWRIINKKNVINKKCKLTSQKLVKNA